MPSTCRCSAKAAEEITKDSRKKIPTAVNPFLIHTKHSLTTPPYSNSYIFYIFVSAEVLHDFCDLPWKNRETCFLKNNPRLAVDITLHI